MISEATLEQIASRCEELQHEMASGITGEKLVAKAQEYAELEPVVKKIEQLRKTQKDIENLKPLLEDPELKALAKEELLGLEHQLPDLEKELRLALIPKDKADSRSAILEIRPAAGGDEASLFAAELFETYHRYAAQHGWKFNILEYNDSDVGGLHTGIAEITGKNVFARLKYESGVHRVQRVPQTETQGRIHTSTITVAVLPEAQEVDVKIDPTEMRVDVFRASGAGGQHVNKTESAVRLTHLPTGITVSMQEEKSQHKNRAKALKIMRARLYEKEREEQHQKRAQNRRSQVGTGERSERIRTYNFPQGRVTDHRIGLTLYKIERIMNGDLDELIDALASHEQAEMLAQLNI